MLKPLAWCISLPTLCCYCRGGEDERDRGLNWTPTQQYYSINRLSLSIKVITRTCLVHVCRRCFRSMGLLLWSFSSQSCLCFPKFTHLFVVFFILSSPSHLGTFPYRHPLSAEVIHLYIYLLYFVSSHHLHFCLFHSLSDLCSTVSVLSPAESSLCWTAESWK